MPAYNDADSGSRRYTRPVRRSGNSLVVTLPPDVLQAAGLDGGDEVVVSVTEAGKGEIRLARDDE